MHDTKLYHPLVIWVTLEDLLVFLFLVLVTIVEGSSLVVVGTDSEPRVDTIRLDFVGLEGSGAGVTVPSVREGVTAGCDERAGEVLLVPLIQANDMEETGVPLSIGALRSQFMLIYGQKRPFPAIHCMSPATKISLVEIASPTFLPVESSCWKKFPESVPCIPIALADNLDLSTAPK